MKFKISFLAMCLVMMCADVSVVVGWPGIFGGKSSGKVAPEQVVESGGYGTKKIEPIEVRVHEKADPTQAKQAQSSYFLKKSSSGDSAVSRPNENVTVDVNRLVRRHAQDVQQIVNLKAKLNSNFINSPDAVKQMKLQVIDSLASDAALQWSPEHVQRLKDYVNESPRFTWKQTVSDWLQDFIDWCLGRKLSDGIEKQGVGGRPEEGMLIKELKTEATVVEMTMQDKVEALKQALKDAGVVKYTPGDSSFAAIRAQYFPDGLPEGVSAKSLFEVAPTNSGLLSGIAGKDISLMNKVEDAGPKPKTLESSNPVVQNAINKLTQSELKKSELENISLDKFESYQEQAARIMQDVGVSKKIKQMVSRNLELLKSVDVSALQAKKQTALDGLNAKLSNASKPESKFLGSLKQSGMTRDAKLSDSSVNQISQKVRKLLTEEDLVRADIQAQVESDFNVNKKDIERNIQAKAQKLSIYLSEQKLADLVAAEKKNMLDDAYAKEENQKLLKDAKARDKAKVVSSKPKFNIKNLEPKVVTRDQQIAELQDLAVKKVKNQIAQEVKDDFLAHEKDRWDMQYYVDHADATIRSNAQVIAEMNRAREQYVMDKIQDAYLKPGVTRQQIIDSVRNDFKNNESVVWEKEYKANHRKAIAADINKAREQYINNKINVELLKNENPRITRARNEALGDVKVERTANATSMAEYNQALASNLFEMSDAQRNKAVKKMEYDLSGKNPDTQGMSKQQLLEYLLKTPIKDATASAKTAWSNEIAVLRESIAKDAPIVNESVVADQKINRDVAEIAEVNPLEPNAMNQLALIPGQGVRDLSSVVDSSRTGVVQENQVSNTQIQAKVKGLQRLEGSSKQLMIAKLPQQASGFKSQINRILSDMNIPSDSPLFTNLAKELNVDAQKQIASWKNSKTQQFDPARFNNWLQGVVLKVNDALVANQ